MPLLVGRSDPELPHPRQVVLDPYGGDELAVCQVGAVRAAAALRRDVVDRAQVWSAAWRL